MVPDILTCGKPLGNGHPLAVVITSREIANCLTDFSTSVGSLINFSLNTKKVRIIGLTVTISPKS